MRLLTQSGHDFLHVIPTLYQNHFSKEREIVHTKTFSALNPRAALEKSAQAESSCTSADGAKLKEGQRVTIDPRIICK
jgi:hypothetical protein